MPVTFLSTLTGSFATPAAENPTVAMMEAAYRQLGLAARYLNCDVAPDRLADAVRGAVAMGWVGFNCSLPHKVAVIELLTELAPSARIIRAVNCVVLREGRLIGENTDGKGFLHSLLPVADPAGAHVMIIGAGGAARAIAVELALAGATRITIANRGTERAAELARLLRDGTEAEVSTLAWSDHLPIRIPGDAQILVNATSLGLYPDISGSPVMDLDTLRADLVVADVIPNPPSTPFLQQAAAAGCRTLDGLGMLVNQGRVAVKLWTGADPDPAVMRQALHQALGIPSC